MLAAGPGELPPRERFDKQKLNTQEHMRRANEEIGLLTEAHKSQPSKYIAMTDDMDDEAKAQQAQVQKLFFMKSQMDAAEKMVANILAQVAAWEKNNFLTKPSAQEVKQQDKFFHEATELLLSIERGFSDVVRIDARLFLLVFQEFQNVLQRYPNVVWGTVSTCAVVGAVLGSGVQGHGVVHLGLHSYLMAKGATTAVCVGTVGGALVGLVFVAGLAVIFVVVDNLFWQIIESEEKKDKKNKEDMLKQIKDMSEKDFDIETIVQLKDLFDALFVKPMAPAVAGQSCAVCLEHFPADGGRVQDRPVKARRCAGNHLVCKKCNSQWLRTSMDDKCVVCRQ